MKRLPQLPVLLNRAWIHTSIFDMSDTESKSDTKKQTTPLFVTPIAKPLANKSLEKKVFKLIKKGKIC